MFIHTTRHGDTFLVTFTSENAETNEGSTVTFRLNREDASALSHQLAHEVTDWHVENEGSFPFTAPEVDEHNDPYERAALMDEYYHNQYDQHGPLFANEPF